MKNELLEERISENRKEVLSDIIDIQARHHNGEVSDIVLEYSGVRQYGSYIKKYAKACGYKQVTTFNSYTNTSKEIEEAIDLYLKHMNTPEEGILRCFTWALSRPLVKGCYKMKCVNFLFIAQKGTEIKSLYNAYESTAFVVFNKCLINHVKNIKSGKLEGRKGAFNYIFYKQLSTIAIDEFVDKELYGLGVFKSKSERRYERSKAHLERLYGRAATEAEIAEYCNVRISTVRKRERMLAQRLCHYQIDVIDEASELCIDEEREELRYLYFMHEGKVWEIVKEHLNDEQKLIMSHFCGFTESGKNSSIAKIARLLGTSEYFIRQKIKEVADIVRPIVVEYIGSIVLT